MRQPARELQLQFSAIIQVASTIQECFEAVGVKLHAHEYEKLSCFINQVYGTRNRAFHDVDHALDVGNGCAPITRLAALFHDVVYIQVDHSRLPELRAAFGVFNPGEALELTLPTSEVIARDPWRQALLTIFGFKPGQKLGVYSGINEILSAWVAVQKLQAHLTPKHLLQIIACIEATIPFRGEMEAPTMAERLKPCVVDAFSLFGLNASKNEIDTIVTEAIHMANNDVIGFGMEEPEVFIYNSWALLYENNPSLQNGLYSITRYREPLQKLEAFLSNLSPKKIFNRYEQYPAEKELQNLRTGAARNIGVAKEYVRTKILDTTILEAFAMVSGGDCPMELFTGPKPKTREFTTARIEHFLDWTTITRHKAGKDEKVIRLLNSGRAGRSKFDVKTALFAAYIYLGLSREEFDQAYASAIEFSKGQLSADNFLNTLPDPIVNHIGEVLCQMAWTRRDAIQVFLKAKKKMKRVA